MDKGHDEYRYLGAKRHPCFWDGVLLATWRTKRKDVLRYRTVYRTRKRDLRGVMVRMGTVGHVVEIRGIVVQNLAY